MQLSALDGGNQRTVINIVEVFVWVLGILSKGVSMIAGQSVLKARNVPYMTKGPLFVI